MSGKKSFSNPTFVINKVYTRHGDDGYTKLVGGQSILKSSTRIVACGTVDELNAFVGSAIVSIKHEIPESEERNWLLKVLNRIQHELFNLGSVLATDPKDIHPKQPQILSSDVDILEQEIDYANDQLSVLRSFVLPGGCRASTDLHVCRTVCRRAERSLVDLMKTDEIPVAILQYINRLSDGFFVWSRFVCKLVNVEEILWSPNAGTE